MPPARPLHTTLTGTPPKVSAPMLCYNAATASLSRQRVRGGFPMNGIDLLFILLLLAGLALGFFQGTIKLLIAIVAFYIGIILASLYFPIVGNFFRVRFHASLEVGQIMAFGLILLLSFLLLTVAGLYTFRYAK